MGRITLFISDSCTYCQRAKRALEERSIPYDVISVASFPGTSLDSVVVARWEHNISSWTWGFCTRLPVCD